jgi:hypothetical protein
MSDGLRTKSWEKRMEQTKKALAVKKLQTELKEEKEAEKQRSVYSLSDMNITRQLIWRP